MKRTSISNHIRSREGWRGERVKGVTSSPYSSHVREINKSGTLISSTLSQLA